MTDVDDYIPWIENPTPSMLWRMETQFDPARTVLAENLKRLRRQAELSQEALALTAEVDRSYVSQIERGIGNPSLLILCRLADVLGVEVASLL